MIIFMTAALFTSLAYAGVSADASTISLSSKIEKIFEVWSNTYGDVCQKPRLGCNYYQAGPEGWLHGPRTVLFWDFGDPKDIYEQTASVASSQRIPYIFDYTSYSFYDVYGLEESAIGFLYLSGEVRIINPFGTLVNGQKGSALAKAELETRLYKPETIEESYLRAEDAARSYAQKTKLNLARARQIARALQDYALVPVVKKRGRTLEDVDAVYQIIENAKGPFVSDYVPNR